jgi:reverse gyrase
MSVRRHRASANATARVIQNLAERNNVSYHMTDSDLLAQNITRLADDDVRLDPIEQMLIGLQRVGRIDRTLMVRLQARYLRESRP